MSMKEYNGFSPSERQAAWVKQKKLAAEGKMRWDNLPCEMCKQHSPAIMPHLEDYNQITKFNPLCPECHMKLHGRFARPGVWLQHLKNLANGIKPVIWPSIGAYIQSRQPNISMAQFQGVEPTRFGNEWWHNLSMKPIDINPRNKTLF